MELRKALIRKRLEIDPNWKKVYDQHICLRLEAFIVERNFSCIHTFLPMRGEPDLIPLLSRLLALGVQLFAPKTLPNRQLIHLELTSLDNLEKGVFNTLHPKNSESSTGPFDLIIVPGLGFTAEGQRLGYGGGYYDTFLAGHLESWTLAPAYPFQILATIPSEDHDIPLDQILILHDI